MRLDDWRKHANDTRNTFKKIVRIGCLVYLWIVGILFLLWAGLGLLTDKAPKPDIKDVIRQIWQDERGANNDR